jgi:hypothetical protein
VVLKKLWEDVAQELNKDGKYKANHYLFVFFTTLIGITNACEGI